MKRKICGIIIVLLALIFISLTLSNKQKNTSEKALITLSAGNVSKPAGNNNDYIIDKLSGSTYVAHRGAVSNKPENSLIAFKVSKKMGFKIVETDLRLTRDGQWIIMHDYTLDRTTNGKGKVESYSLSEIRKLKLASNEGEDISIPTLDEFLKLCSDENIIPILDIKPNELQISYRAYDKLLNSLNKYGLLDKTIICSYSKDVLAEIRRRNKAVAIAVMMDATQENLDFVNMLHNSLIYCNYKNLIEDKIKLIQENKVKFGVWTVDDEKDAQYFRDKGAVLIVTDNLK